MNIFFLDYCPKKAAMYHCDKHVVKMITETSQMISTNYSLLVTDDNKEKYDFLMKKCFVNHPCTKWARESRQNYVWLVNLLSFLLKEYEYRYEKKGFERSKKILTLKIPENFNTDKFTQPALALPDDCKISDDPVLCYREYYRKYKKHFATWKKREKPYWWFS